jgi:hypothetical protein
VCFSVFLPFLWMRRFGLSGLPIKHYKNISQTLLRKIECFMTNSLLYLGLDLFTFCIFVF